jgi:hypothetical protein
VEWGRHGYRAVTDEQAELIANHYFLQERDRLKIGMAIGMGRTLDVEWLVHPSVQRAIAAIVLSMRRDKLYSREEHIKMLQQIRDHCIKDDNWKTALAAEISVGKAAGLYENIGTPDDPDGISPSNKPVETLDSDQIKRRLEKLRTQKALPAADQVVDHEPTYTKPSFGGDPPF